MVGHGTNFKNSEFKTRKSAQDFVSNRELEFDHDLRIDLAEDVLQDVVEADLLQNGAVSPTSTTLDLREPPAIGEAGSSVHAYDGNKIWR